MNVESASLVELEDESRRLSTHIRELQDRRREVDAEISKRHESIAKVKHLAQLSPAEIDRSIRPAPQPAE